MRFYKKVLFIVFFIRNVLLLNAQDVTLLFIH